MVSFVNKKLLYHDKSLSVRDIVIPYPDDSQKTISIRRQPNTPTVLLTIDKKSYSLSMQLWGNTINKQYALNHDNIPYDFMLNGKTYHLTYYDNQYIWEEIKSKEPIINPKNTKYQYTEDMIDFSLDNNDTSNNSSQSSSTSSSIVSSLDSDLFPIQGAEYCQDPKHCYTNNRYISLSSESSPIAKSILLRAALPDYHTMTTYSYDTQTYHREQVSHEQVYKLGKQHHIAQAYEMLDENNQPIKNDKGYKLYYGYIYGQEDRDKQFFYDNGQIIE